MHYERTLKKKQIELYTHGKWANTFCCCCILMKILSIEIAIVERRVKHHHTHHIRMLRKNITKSLVYKMWPWRSEMLYIILNLIILNGREKDYYIFLKDCRWDWRFLQQNKKIKIILLNAENAWIGYLIKNSRGKVQENYKIIFLFICW